MRSDESRLGELTSSRIAELRAIATRNLVERCDEVQTLRPPERPQ